VRSVLVSEQADPRDLPSNMAGDVGTVSAYLGMQDINICGIVLPYRNRGKEERRKKESTKKKKKKKGLSKRKQKTC
jgi:hypothetical protein